MSMRDLYWISLGGVALFVLMMSVSGGMNCSSWPC